MPDLCSPPRRMFGLRCETSGMAESERSSPRTPHKVTDCLLHQESRNVVDLRERIKTFLAAQGMIKGHSGSGPRAADHSPPVLRLADSDTGSSSSGTPPTPTLTLSTEGTRHHISSMRDDPWTTTLSPVEPYNPSGQLNPSFESPLVIHYFFFQDYSLRMAQQI